MATTRIGTVWSRQPNGLLLPSGTFSDTSLSGSVANHLQLRSQAAEIEELYTEVGIRIPPHSGLGQMLTNAKELSQDWLLNRTGSKDFPRFFQSVHFHRLANIVLSLRAEPQRARYLKDILTGTLNFLERRRSKAKDTLWELEVCAALRQRIPNVVLKDPPDIEVLFRNHTIGIACKRIYSDRHIQNVLSQAVAQVQDNDFGIAALCLDELLPGEAILRMNSVEEAQETLNEHNTIFIKKHARHFEKYLTNSRLISCIISTNTITDIPTARPQFSTHYQWTCWSITDIPEKPLAALRAFYEAIMGSAMPVST